MRLCCLILLLMHGGHIQLCSGNNNDSRERRKLRGFPNQNDTGRRLSTDTIFRITTVGTYVEDSNGKITTQEDIACIPIVGGKESDEMFKIRLPNDTLKSNQAKIMNGDFFLAISDTELQNNEIILKRESTITVQNDPRVSSRVDENTKVGTKKLAIVRISTRDAYMDDDAQTLKDGLFSTTKINLKTQFSACSFGQLQWELAGDRIVEVKVDEPVSNFDSGAALVSAAQKTMVEQGMGNASDLGDKVLMCLPPGTGNWVASSGVNHWRAQFNNNWCRSLTATMHELGHTLGLNHANEDGRPYGDSTGYMAAGHRQPDWPQKCFNGLKNHELGWYSKREAGLDADFLLKSKGSMIKLATFVDFDLTDDDEPVLFNIADQFFLQYNVAKDFNIDTEEKRNEVTITAPSDTGSEGLKGLAEGSQYMVPNFDSSGRTLFIEACRKKKGSRGADVMLVSVALDVSLCDSFYIDDVSYTLALSRIRRTGKPTTVPTKTPVRAPTKAPTKSPTGTPTKEPTSFPTEEPSAKPSIEPTKAPTLSPSKEPTRTPTVIPTDRPTNTPTIAPTSLPPTKTPTGRPSISPSMLPTISYKPSGAPITPTSSPTKIDFQSLFKEFKDGRGIDPPKIDYHTLLKLRKAKIEEEKINRIQPEQDTVVPLVQDVFTKKVEDSGSSSSTSSVAIGIPNSVFQHDQSPST